MEGPAPVTPFSRLPILFLLATALGAPPALAASDTAQMLKLAPRARMEQRCNARAMGLISREHKGLRPDELVAYAFADTVAQDGKVEAPGAAVRSAGKWYHLSYVCQTTDAGMGVSSFQYSLGAVVPTQQWAEHYLVP